MSCIRSLSKRFGEQILFEDLSYPFPACGCVLITGDSGSGKTTLLRLLAGLDPVYSGQIEGFFGNVAVSFQEYRLFPRLTALQNVTELAFASCTQEQKKRARALLINFGFTADDCKKRPAELSGGMRQRVGIARALASEKPILLLDEPTKELDGELARTVRETIAEQAENRLVLLVSHNPADRAFFLATGAGEICIEKRKSARDPI